MAVNTVNIFCKCLLRINRALLMNKDFDPLVRMEQHCIYTGSTHSHDGSVLLQTWNSTELKKSMETFTYNIPFHRNQSEKHSV